VDPNFVPAKYSFVSLEGFLNAKVLVEVLKRASKNLTRRKFVEALEGIKGLDVGLGPKVSFNKTKHQGLNAVFFTTIENGKYISINDWTKLQ
jgi:ABC-type branched-subunit amino acid transport system substrate-binding protein